MFSMHTCHIPGLRKELEKESLVQIGSTGATPKLSHLSVFTACVGACGYSGINIHLSNKTPTKTMIHHHSIQYSTGKKKREAISSPSYVLGKA